MKVLKQGRPQKGWATKCVCTGDGNGGGGCGAKLLVEEADLYKTYSHCMHETDEHVEFTCPCCGVRTEMDDRVVPSARYLPDKTEWLKGKKERRDPDESA